MSNPRQPLPAVMSCLVEIREGHSRSHLEHFTELRLDKLTGTVVTVAFDSTIYLKNKIRGATEQRRDYRALPFQICERWVREYPTGVARIRDRFPIGN